MSLAAAIPGANFYANSVSFALKVERGLLGLFFLWDDLNRAVINHAGGPDLVVRGTPVMQSHYAECKGLQAYFESLIFERPEMTAIAACWNPDANAAGVPMYLGNFQGAGVPPRGALSSAGFGLYSSANTLIRGLSGRIAPGPPEAADSTPTTLSEPANALNFYSFRVLNTGGTSLKSWATGTRVTNASLSHLYPRLPNILPLRIGSGYTSFAGLANVSIVALFGGPLTDDEERQVVEQLRDVLAAVKQVYVPIAA